MISDKRVVIRLVWDFFGPPAQGTATHFRRHLIQFLEENGCEPYVTDVEQISQVHAAAFGDVSPEYFELVSQALKPHRAYEVNLSD